MILLNTASDTDNESFLSFIPIIQIWSFLIFYSVKLNVLPDLDLKDL